MTLIKIVNLCLLAALAYGVPGWCNPITEYAPDVPTNLSATSATDYEDYLNTTVLYYLYTKSNVDNPQRIWKNDVSTLKSSYFDSSKKTLVLIHGYMNCISSAIIQDIKNAVLKFEDVNVIGVDWSRYAKDIIYTTDVNRVPRVGIYVGQLVNFLINEGLSEAHTHVIGHSLGAHVAGFAGKQLKTVGRLAGRVTGLDPAYPGFGGDSPSKRLDAGDASFVDCIHTCAGLLGYDLPICQADFYPNGGTNPQPGCRWLFDFGSCSHGRSFQYYAESIDPSHHFNAAHCNSIVSGVPYGCVQNGAEMGYYASPQFQGEFYLTTASKSPFSLNITTESI